MQKGSRTQCKNYRGISLLGVPGKVYATVPDKRIRAITVRGESARRAGCCCLLMIVAGPIRPDVIRLS